MPILKLTLIKGYSAKLPRGLWQKITDLIVQLIGAIPEVTSVMIEEVDQASYMRWRENKRPVAPAPPTGKILKGYLDAMEARDLSKAASFLAEKFWMDLPGPVRMAYLEELVAWSKPRYQKVEKIYYYDPSEVYREDYTLATCHGVLHGIWPAGTQFRNSGLSISSHCRVEKSRAK